MKRKNPTAWRKKMASARLRTTSPAPLALPSELSGLVRTPPEFNGTMTDVQQRLANEIAVHFRTSNAVVLKGAVGIGKTLIAGAAIRHVASLRAKVPLVIAIAPSLRMARDQFAEYGANSKLKGLTSKGLSLLRQYIREWRSGNEPVTLTMTKESFCTFCREGDDGEKSAFDKIIREEGVQDVFLIIDEVGNFMRRPGSKLVGYVDHLRNKIQRLCVLGMAADPEAYNDRYMSQDQHVRAKTRCYGTAEPPTVENTEEERQIFQNKIIWQGERLPAPRQAKPVVREPDSSVTMELENAILGCLLFQQKDSDMKLDREYTGEYGETIVEDDHWEYAQGKKNELNTYVKNILGKLEADQLLNGKIRRPAMTQQIADDDIVLLGDSVRVDMTRVTKVECGQVTEFERVKHHHVVLALAATTGARYHALGLMRNINSYAKSDDPGFAPYRIHDLTGDEVSRAQNLENMMREVAKDEFLHIGLINKAQARGSNEFAKGFTRTLVFGGNLSSTEWDQFHGRIGRRCTPEVGDVFCSPMTGTHVKCPLFDDILDAILRRQARLDIVEKRVRENDSWNEKMNYVLAEHGPDVKRGFLKCFQMKKGAQEIEPFFFGGNEDLVTKYCNLLEERKKNSLQWNRWANTYHINKDKFASLWSQDADSDCEM